MNNNKRWHKLYTTNRAITQLSKWYNRKWARIVQMYCRYQIEMCRRMCLRYINVIDVDIFVGTLVIWHWKRNIPLNKGFVWFYQRHFLQIVKFILSNRIWQSYLRLKLRIRSSHTFHFNEKDENNNYMIRNYQQVTCFELRFHL